jgi:hypothetical protein
MNIFYRENTNSLHLRTLQLAGWSQISSPAFYGADFQVVGLQSSYHQVVSVVGRAQHSGKEKRSTAHLLSRLSSAQIKFAVQISVLKSLNR